MKKKANLRRFLLNRYIAYVTWIMMFLPIVILFFDTAVETDKPFYQIAIVVFVFAFAAYLNKGETVNIKGRKSTKRYKYRYVILSITIFLACILCSLLDFYFYGNDYFQDVVSASIFYTLFTLPVAVVRTYYSRCLDLLDAYYYKHEDHFLVFLIVSVIGFYMCMGGFIYLSDLIGIKKMLFNNNVLSFIFITVLEFVLFLICYFSYVLYKKSRNKYIYYK